MSHPTSARSRAATDARAQRSMRVARRRAAVASADGVGRWELQSADGGDRVRAAGFLDRLEAMTRAEWLAVGDRATACASDPTRLAATAALARAVDGHRLGVTVWLVRDAVATAVQTAPRSWPSAPSTRAEVTLLATGRDAATVAVLAQLARPWLERSEVAALLAPFPSTIDGGVALRRRVAPLDGP